METALLFCAIRLSEVLGTLSYARDPRAGYETALCMRKIGYRLSADLGDTELCINAPALTLEAVLHPRRFGSVATCYTGAFVKKPPHKVRNKYQDRLRKASDLSALKP
jgi:hypothetical protein